MLHMFISGLFLLMLLLSVLLLMLLFSGSNLQEVEMAVTLLYELGEGAPEEALKPGSGALGQLALLLMGQSQLPAGQHRLVALAVMECTVRYCRALQQQQGVIPSVLSLFLDARGLGHPSPDVSTRACYLFSRVVKQLRSNLRAFVSDVMRNLQSHLVAVATIPPSSGSAAVSSSKDGAGKAMAPSTSLVDDRLYLFEAVGLLLGQEELPAEQQQAALSSLLQPLMRQVGVLGE